MKLGPEKMHEVDDSLIRAVPNMVIIDPPFTAADGGAADNGTGQVSRLSRTLGTAWQFGKYEQDAPELSAHHLQ